MKNNADEIVVATLKKIGNEVKGMEAEIRGKRTCLISAKWKEFLASLGYIHIYHTFEQKMTDYDMQIRDEKEDFIAMKKLYSTLFTEKEQENARQKMKWYQERIQQFNFLKQKLSDKKSHYDRDINVNNALRNNVETLSRLYEVNYSNVLAKIETAMGEENKLYNDFINEEGEHHQRDSAILLDAMARDDEETLKKLKEAQQQFKRNHFDTMNNLINRKQQLLEELKANSKQKVKLFLVTSTPFVFAKGLLSVVTAPVMDFKSFMNNKMKEKKKPQSLKNKTVVSTSTSSPIINANQESITTIQKLIDEFITKTANNPVARQQCIDMLKHLLTMYSYISKEIEEDIGKRK